MKKENFFLNVTFVVILSLIFTSDFALAGMYNSGADGPSGLNNPLGLTNSLSGFLEAVMQHLQGIIAFLAVMFIVIGGILYTMAGGNQTLVTTAKVCVMSAIIGLTLAAGGPSFLKQIKFSIYGAAPVSTNIASAPTIANIVDRTLTFLLSIAGILGIIGLTVSGLLYIFAAGNSSQAEKAKEAVKYSIGGIIIAGAALIIVKQIVLFFT